MNRFRIRNNVPDVYVKQSRDFQLMCDLFDLVNNGVKFDIDTIMDLSDTELCRESMLPYLQKKLGFNLSKEITSENLRKILKSFPYLVNYKGSKMGIEKAIALFLHVIYSDCAHTVTIYNNVSSDSILGPYVINVELKDRVLKQLHILQDLLKYIVPCGYKVHYDLQYYVDDMKTHIHPKNTVNIIVVDEDFGSAVRKAYAEVKKSENSTENSNETYETGNKVYNDPSTDDTTPGVIGSIGATVIRYSSKDSNNRKVNFENYYSEGLENEE